MNTINTTHNTKTTAKPSMPHFNMPHFNMRQYDMPHFNTPDFSMPTPSVPKCASMPEVLRGLVPFIPPYGLHPSRPLV